MAELMTILCRKFSIRFSKTKEKDVRLGYPSRTKLQLDTDDKHQWIIKNG